MAGTRIAHLYDNGSNGWRIAVYERDVARYAFGYVFLCLCHNDYHGVQFLSKNPPHTGRVRLLLEMFPNAKFIYMKRNPYTVFESTRSFFKNTIVPLRLQNISEEQFESNLLEVYRRLFYKFEEQKVRIPKGNLVEVKFEEFEREPMEMTEAIYQQLDLPGFAESKDRIFKYIHLKDGYSKNHYKYDDNTLKTVEENWGMALKAWNYSLEQS